MIGTLDILKSDWLGITNNSEDARATRALTAASKDITTICHQPIEQTSTVYDFAGNFASDAPIYYTVPVVLTSLQSRFFPYESWTTETGTTLYEVNGLKYIHLQDGYHRRLYRATMQVGYTTIPLDIQTAAYKLAKEYYLQYGNRAGQDRFGLSEVVTDNGVSTTTQRFKDIRAEVVRTLAPYTRFLP